MHIPKNILYQSDRMSGETKKKFERFFDPVGVGKSAQNRVF